jgi:hypothetical protein
LEIEEMTFAMTTTHNQDTDTTGYRNIKGNKLMTHDETREAIINLTLELGRADEALNYMKGRCDNLKAEIDDLTSRYLGRYSRALNTARAA